MDVPTEDVSNASLTELLYAYNLVLWWGIIMGKYGRWKNAVEGKGLRMNVECHMQLLFGKKSSVSKVDPCGVYDE